MGGGLRPAKCSRISLFPHSPCCPSHILKPPFVMLRSPTALQQPILLSSAFLTVGKGNTSVVMRDLSKGHAAKARYLFLFVPYCGADVL